MPFFVHIHIEDLKNELKTPFFGHIHIGDLKNKHDLIRKFIHELRYLIASFASASFEIRFVASFEVLGSKLAAE